VQYRILGPLDVVQGDLNVRIAPGRERTLLLLLLINTPAPVSLRRIIDALWPDDPPESAQKIVQNYVLRLRKALGADAIRTTASGYALETPVDAVDATVAAALLERSAQALDSGDADTAGDTATKAVSMWRGDAMYDVREERFAQPEIARLDELHASGLELAFEAALRLGRHEATVGALQQHVLAHPLRERPRRQLMLALYRSGRQADALAVYRDARASFAEQGLEPTKDLRELERAMLNDEVDPAPAALRPEDGTPRPEGRPPRLSRRRRIAAAALAAASAVSLGTVLLLRHGDDRSVSSLTADSLARINPVTGAVELSVPVGKTPTDVAASPTAVWTTNFDDRTVTRLDLRTRREVVVGGVSTPTAIAASPAGVWVISDFDGAVERLEPASGAVLAVLHLPSGLSAVATGAGRVWISNETRGSLSSIDPRTNRVVETLGGFDRPVGVAFGAGRTWITEAGSRRLDAVSPDSGRVALRIPLSLRPGGLAFGANDLWVLDPFDAAVTRVDAFTGSQRVISVGQVPSHIAVQSGRVWVTTDRDHAILVLDASNGALLKRLTLSNAATPAPGSAAITPGGLAAANGAVWLTVQAF
jgi:DNA-binding SARP family transcriptional activator/streptogramin lyase